MTEEKKPLIYAAMSAIMGDVDPIAKARQNKAQGYQFRGIDDVYAALQSILAKHSVFTVSEIISQATEEKQSKSGGTMFYRVLHIRYRFYAADGSYVTTEVIGEGMDSGDKASNKAMSVAHQYALLQAFCIPTEDPKDPENDSHVVGQPPRQATPPKQQQAAPPRQSAPAALVFDCAKIQHIEHVGRYIASQPGYETVDPQLVEAISQYCHGRKIEPGMIAGAFNYIMKIGGFAE